MKTRIKQIFVFVLVTLVLSLNIAAQTGNSDGLSGQTVGSGGDTPIDERSQTMGSGGFTGGLIGSGTFTGTSDGGYDLVPDWLEGIF